MAEVWKQLPGYENYQVSSYGRVCRSKGGKGTRAGKIRKICTLPSGYQYIDLWEEGVCTRLYIHHAVLFAFKGPAPPGKQAAHWSGKRSNNKLSNLRWATPFQNNQDKHRHGTFLEGSKCPQSKLTEAAVLKIRRLRAKGTTLEELAAAFGIGMQNIGLICQRKTWKHVKDDLPKVIQTGCWRMGERSHKAKLSERQVLAIRKKFAQGSSVQAITRQYPVSWGAVDAICKRISWKHI